MFQNRTSGDKPKARAPYTDRYPREKVIGGLILGTAIFMAGFMAGYDYKTTPATPADPSGPTAPATPLPGPADPNMTLPNSVPTTTMPASNNAAPPSNTMPATGRVVPATQLAPLPKLAYDLAPLPKVGVVTAKTPDDPAPEPKVAAPSPKTVERTPAKAAKPKGTAAPVTSDGKS